MNQITKSEPPRLRHSSAGLPGSPARRQHAARYLIGAAGFVLFVGVCWYVWHGESGHAAPLAPPRPQVTVAHPLNRVVAAETSFLGQFSAVDRVEIRAQVGGILTSIGFTDGQIVHKGDALFTIDPRPYEVKLRQAAAQLQSALAKKQLTSVELWRAQRLKQNDFGSAESVDQRAADDRSAEAEIETARAAVSDAQLDLGYARIVAPFTGRIGAHLVSIGNLVSGSRGGTSPTTLLATIVSLDPIYLDFDLSESDYLAFRNGHPGAVQTNVVIAQNGDGAFNRHGSVDFVDNSVNRGSGTIHLRATVPNPDLMLMPGEFARLKLPMGKPAPVLLVPASAIVPDQNQTIVMVVGKDGKVAPRIVQIGALYDGLRIVTSGLSPDDNVVIDGLMMARPGMDVTAIPGSIKPSGSTQGI